MARGPGVTYCRPWQPRHASLASLSWHSNNSSLTSSSCWTRGAIWALKSTEEEAVSLSCQQQQREPAWSWWKDGQGTYRLPVIPWVTLVPRATRRPRWPSVSHTAMRARITTKTWGTFFSWFTNRPSRPWGSLKKMKTYWTLF